MEAKPSVADPGTAAGTTLFGGDRRALARAISRCEREPDAVGRLLERAHAHATGTLRIGITGPPGSGKSTLTDKLLGVYRRHGRRVAVVAVDPSSPYSGGSLLGDRVRMGSHTGDPGVFIRSMSTRGRLGGLNASAEMVAVLLDAEGYGPIIFETVGVGQSEVEVIDRTDTVVVVVAPGFGDDVQAEKAGLMEVGDVFVVNKADHPGAIKAARTLESMVSMGPAHDWRPPVLLTVAETGEGVDEVVDAIRSHNESMAESGALRARRRARAEAEISRMIERLAGQATEPAVARYSEAVMEGATDPWSAATEIFDSLLTGEHRPRGS
ncbi:methylmalonyl Co-A mutase-associated GTPase MeaB [Candidatus Spongiisocius sp.]|uniref:methylmalonyl Co-A mutase-associated GTPase MeaB n=1 Tax=Candidatus Spongiisocius sp. TaxID=3101273 RepID=UPI003B596600